jgi:hypothetical protein
MVLVRFARNIANELTVCSRPTALIFSLERPVREPPEAGKSHIVWPSFRGPDHKPDELVRLRAKDEERTREANSLIPNGAPSGGKATGIPLQGRRAPCWMEASWW